MTTIVVGFRRSGVSRYVETGAVAAFGGPAGAVEVPLPTRRSADGSAPRSARADTDVSVACYTTSLDPNARRLDAPTPKTMRRLLDAIGGGAGPVTVHLLVTPRTELLERLQWPDDVASTDEAYDLLRAKARLEHVDIAEVLQRWGDACAAAGATVRLVRSSLHSFDPIDDGELATVVDEEVTSTATRYLPEDILALVEERGPQRLTPRVDLPYGLTAGRPTSMRGVAAMLAALDAPMAGRSVLDVGCGTGARCFAAARRGATTVVGADHRPTRLESARIFADILGSTVTFAHDQVLEGPPWPTYDDVLAIDALHSYYDPEEALLTAATLARRRLVVEIPTLADEGFRKRWERRRRTDGFIFSAERLEEVRAVLDPEPRLANTTVLEDGKRLLVVWSFEHADDHTADDHTGGDRSDDERRHDPEPALSPRP